MKERLDILLLNNGLAESREKAKALIMSGIVFVDGQREDKAGSMFRPDAQISVRGNTLRYVSRGGLKLEKAIDEFAVELQGIVCLDAGASTGGFTDCMLQNGAVRVYAVDVGTNQLDWRLRNDSRVISMEKTNIRYLEPSMIPERVDFVSIDVSFISLKKVLLPLRAIMKEGACMVCLIKPQFEAGREKVGKKGVVKDAGVHLEVVQDIISFAVNEGEFEVKNLSFSPIRGPEGNIEYLLYLRKPAEIIAAVTEHGVDGPALAELAARGLITHDFSEVCSEEYIRKIVGEAHASFGV